MSISLVEKKKYYQEVRLDLGRRQAPLVYSYYRPDGRDAASLERTTRILRQLELSYSCCHEGGHNPAVPSGSQGSDRIHLHQPYRKVGRKEILDEKEDDTAEKESV
jgi:hypothetical protein